MSCAYCKDITVCAICGKGYAEAVRASNCEHRYLTSHGRGWECADCGVGILSLAVPLPLPLVAEALRAIADVAERKTEPNGAD